jgi:hypothetical protein
LSKTTIEIIPLHQESADKRQYVSAHEIYFHTAAENFGLVSELVVR